MTGFKFENKGSGRAVAGSLDELISSQRSATSNLADSDVTRVQATSPLNNSDERGQGGEGCRPQTPESVNCGLLAELGILQEHDQCGHALARLRRDRDKCLRGGTFVCETSYAKLSPSSLPRVRSRAIIFSSFGAALLALRPSFATAEMTSSRTSRSLESSELKAQVGLGDSLDQR